MMYCIDGQSDVFVDACIPDDAGQLLFLSAFGRDTSLQQMLARFQLRATEGGLDRITIRREEEPFTALVGDPNRLEKLTGRLPRETLFGNLVHLWVFDPVVLEPDRANGRGWILVEEEEHRGERCVELRAQRRWLLLSRLARVPLLDEWRDPLLEALEAEFPSAWHTSGCIGRLSAERLALPDAFESLVSGLLTRGALCAQGAAANPAAGRRGRGSRAVH